MRNYYAKPARRSRTAQGRPGEAGYISTNFAEPAAHIEVVAFPAPRDVKARSWPRGSVWVSHIRPDGHVEKHSLTKWMRLDAEPYMRGMVMRIDVQARQYDTFDYPAHFVSQWIEITHDRSDTIMVGFGCGPERDEDTWRFGCYVTGARFLPEPVLENFRDYESFHRVIDLDGL